MSSAHATSACPCPRICIPWVRLRSRRTKNFVGAKFLFTQNIYLAYWTILLKVPLRQVLKIYFNGPHLYCYLHSICGGIKNDAYCTYCPRLLITQSFLGIYSYGSTYLYLFRKQPFWLCYLHITFERESKRFLDSLRYSGLLLAEMWLEIHEIDYIYCMSICLHVHL